MTRGGDSTESAIEKELNDEMKIDLNRESEPGGGLPSAASNQPPESPDNGGAGRPHTSTIPPSRPMEAFLLVGAPVDRIDDHLRGSDGRRIEG